MVPASVARRPKPGRRPGDDVGRPFSSVQRWRIWVPILNLAILVGADSARSWVRHLRIASPAIASLWLLLSVAGLTAIAGIAIQTAARSEVASASLLHVYLREGSAPAEVDALRASLSNRPDVRSVVYTSKEQALASARGRPGLSELAALADGNPFPASLDVQVDSLGHLQAVAAAVASDPAVDPRHPTSYDGDVYARLRQAVLATWLGAGAIVLVLGAVAVLIVASSMRAVVLARRTELETLGLLGAPPWLLRARVTFEGVLSGALAGTLSGLLLLALFHGVTALDARMLSEALPGVTAATAVYVGAAVLAAGLVIAGLTSASAFRRSLR